MTVDDLPAVHAHRAGQPSRTPWPAHAYRQELETNRLAHYLVARSADEIVGLRRHLADGRRGPRHDLRGRARAWRRRRIGERLLLALLDLAVARARARGDARGPARPTWRPAGCTRSTASGRGRPAALLQRQPRRRADHDHASRWAADEARIAELRAAVAARPDWSWRRRVPDRSTAVAASSTDEAGSGGPMAPGEPGAPSTPETGSPRVIRPSSVSRRPL